MTIHRMESSPTFSVIHVEASIGGGLKLTLQTNDYPTPEYIAAMLSTSFVRVSIPEANS
jgi:hypothetical protein